MFSYAADGYNYADFVMRREVPYFQSFRDRLHIGERAPDFELTRLDDGQRVRLADHWTEGALVVEFGSFT